MYWTRKTRILEILLNLLAAFGVIAFIIYSKDSLTSLGTQMLSSQRTHSSSHNLGVNTRQHGSKRKMAGNVVVHQWLQECGFKTLRDMYQSSLFPKYPDSIIVINELSLNSATRNLARRMSGYLHVPETGFYSFRLKTIGEAELWLMPTSNSKRLRRVVRHVSDNKDNSIQESDFSSAVLLEEEMAYSFELMHVGMYVEIRWLLPGSRQFMAVPSQYTSYDSISLTHEPVDFKSNFSSTLDSTDKQRVTAAPFYLVAYPPQWVTNSAIPRCAIDVRNIKKTDSNSHLNINTMALYSDLGGTEKDLWNKTTGVSLIVNLYMKRLEKVYPKKYKVKRVYKMEKIFLSENQMPVYLMQLEFDVDGLDYTERVVKYIHQHNSTAICQPTNLSWNEDAYINLIIVIKDGETKWLRRFIGRLEMVFELTLEVNMHLIVVNYDKSGLDIGAILNQTSLTQRYTIMNLAGVFSMSRGFNEGVSLAKGKQPIILACDVHVDIPDTIFEDTKTHCVQERIAFSPIVFQLGCGEDPRAEHPKGHWCEHTYNVIGIYKTDWERISGMDDTKFGPKMEFDFVHKINRNGISIVRYKYQGLNRYHVPPEDDPYQAKLVAIETGYFEKDDQ